MTWFITNSVEECPFIQNSKNLELSPYISMTLFPDRSQIFDTNDVPIINMIRPFSVSNNGLVKGIPSPIPKRTKTRVLFPGDIVIVKVNDFTFTCSLDIWWPYLNR